MADHTIKAGRLLGVIAVIILLLVGISVLMPSLKHAKELSKRVAMESESRTDMMYGAPAGPPTPVEGHKAADQLHAELASILTFDADIELLPRLSVGTATPESIYESKFAGTLEAKRPTATSGPCQILLPLPPQIISLAELKITVNGEPSQDVDYDGKQLVWRGQLPPTGSSKLTVAYTAVGKGIYKLEKPPGKIIEQFRTKLVARKSNIRMLELSLQPNSLSSSGGDTTYLWDYKQLLVSSPIALDVLGIAAQDQLGEIVWLGPVSVLLFGVLSGLMLAALRPQDFSALTVLLIVGCFAAAYPLMYFLQEFLSLWTAIALAAAVSLAIIVVRSILLLGFKSGLLGGLVIPALVMGLTVLAAIYTRPAIQGVLLTLLCIVMLVVTMVLLPRAKAAIAPTSSTPQPPTPAAG